MNANPKFTAPDPAAPKIIAPLFNAENALVDAAAIEPLPNSRKVYVQGSRPDIRVPMRAITSKVLASAGQTAIIGFAALLLIGMSLAYYGLPGRLKGAVVMSALKLVLLAAAAVFGLSLLFVGLLSMAFVLLKALLTGRKPAFVTTFQRFNQARQQFRRGGFGAAGSAATGGFGNHASVADVVDVQAHEVRDEQALPYRPGADRR